MNFISEILPNILSRKPHGVLYHYTSAEGLLGICSTKKLWASNIHYLNDSKEYAHALDLLRSEIKNRRKVNGSTLLIRLWELLDLIDRVKVVVCSFSEVGDLLSQWRGYCPPGLGYSVGFDARQLEQAASTQGYSLVPCLYHKDEQRKVIKSVVDETEARYSNSYQTKEEEFKMFFLGAVVSIAPLIKHSSFSEEQEWRLSSFPVANTIAKEKFRVGKRSLIPYQELDLRNPQGEMHIEGIYVDPTEDQVLAGEAVYNFCRNSDVILKGLKYSETPFRGW